MEECQQELDKTCEVAKEEAEKSKAAKEIIKALASKVKIHSYFHISVFGLLCDRHFRGMFACSFKRIKRNRVILRRPALRAILLKSHQSLMIQCPFHISHQSPQLVPTPKTNN